MVSIAEPVELGSTALGVCTHILKVQPIAHIKSLSTSPGLRDAINAIAGRAPDGVFQRQLGGSVISGNCIRVVVVGSQGIVLGLEDARDGVLVVEHDGAEVAVHAVVEVEHVAVYSESLVFDRAAGNNVAGDGEGGGNVVATGLADDAHAGREVFVQGD